MSVDVAFNLTSTVKDSVTNEQYAGKTANDTSTVDKFSSQRFAIANAVTNQLIEMDNITTASEVLITSDQPLTVKINLNTNPAITFTEKFLIQGGSFTALYLSNASGNTANVSIIVAGS